MYKAELVKSDYVAPPVTACGINLIPTGDYLQETFPDGSSQTLIVYKGSATPYSFCRDCGDHFIIARWDRIDKATMEITVDVEDR